MRRMSAMLFAIASLAATRCRAHAEYEPGRVPEATNAFTLHHGQTRLSLIGSSALGLGASTELTTYLAADLVLFFNFEIKSAFAQTQSFQAAWMLGIAPALCR